jgi:hypothetical protein
MRMISHRRSRAVWIARKAHNLEVAGSNPVSAPMFFCSKIKV